MSELFPGIPLVHDPFFESLWQETNSDLDRIARTLNQEGFAVFDFPEPDFDQLASKIKEDVSPRFNWENWENGVAEDLRIQDAWTFSDEVRQIATNQTVCDMLSKIYGREAFPFQTLNFGVGTQQSGHSDHVHFDSVPAGFMCGVWVAMEDIDAQNGGLFYYPGSQSWPVLRNEHMEADITKLEQGESIYSYYDRFANAWEQLAKLHGVEPSIPSLRKGQAVIWTANVVHGGSPHLDRSRTRWSQVTHYFFEGCAFTTPLANNHARGEVFLRELKDIRTGEIRPNVLFGEELSQEHVNRMKPKFLKEKQQSSKWPVPEDFDPEAYLAKNEDVRKSGMDPRHHYWDHGRFEGRTW